MTGNCSNCGTALPDAEEQVSRPPRDWTDPVAGFIAGLVTLGFGLLATFLFSDVRGSRDRVMAVRDAEGIAGAVASDVIPDWYYFLSWEFFENHQVPVSAAVGDLFGAASWTSEYVETLLPTASNLQFLLPALLVVAGAFVTARRVSRSPGSAATAGMTVALGYFPGVAAIASIATFEITVFGEALLLEVGPAFGRAVILAGAIYPLFFGGAGGLLVFFGRALYADDQ